MGTGVRGECVIQRHANHPAAVHMWLKKGRSNPVCWPTCAWMHLCGLSHRTQSSNMCVNGSFIVSLCALCCSLSEEEIHFIIISVCTVRNEVGRNKPGLCTCTNTHIDTLLQSRSDCLKYAKQFSLTKNYEKSLLIECSINNEHSCPRI